MKSPPFPNSLIPGHWVGASGSSLLCTAPLFRVSIFLFLASFSPLPAATISLESLSRLKDSSGNDLTNGLVLVGSFFNRADTGPIGISSLFSTNLATTRANLSSTNFFSTFAEGAVQNGGTQFVGRDYISDPAGVPSTNAVVQFINSVTNAPAFFAEASLFLLIFNQATVETSTEMMIFRPFLDADTGTRAGFPQGDDGDAFFSLEAPLISDFYPELFFGTWSDDGVMDGDGLRGSLNTAPMNQTFGITSPLTAVATNGSPFTYQIRANNGPISYEATNLPGGLSYTASNGVISGVPNDTATNYSVVLKSFGDTVTATSTLVLTLNAAAGSPPVILTPTDSVTLVAGVNYSNAYTITASNAATNPPILFYGASNLPTGLSVNTNNGVISGTPTQLVTNRTITLSADNGAAGFGQIALTVTAPSLTYGALTFTAGTASNSSGPLVTPGYQPTNYASTNLPAGLVVGSNGVISGAPTVPGVITTSTITALDSNGVSSSSAEVVITVNTLRPTINSTNAYTVFRGSNSTPYAITTVLTSTVVAPTSFSVSRGSLPQGMSLNPTSGVISGTPSGSKGVTSVGLKADNSGVPGGGAGPEFDLTLRVDVNPPVFHLALRKNVAAGFPFHANNDALIATNDPENFSLAGAPGWLKLANVNEGGRTLGRISGTPPSAGTWTIPVTIANTNLAGTRQTNTTNLIITAVASAPTAGSLGISPGTFVLNQNLAVTYPPDGFFLAGRDLGADAATSINVLGLPPGVSFANLDDRRRGLLTGTPTQLGTYPCTVYVRNAKGFTRSTMTFRVVSP